jgi:hypothetical protein
MWRIGLCREATRAPRDPQTAERWWAGGSKPPALTIKTMNLRYLFALVIIAALPSALGASDNTNGRNLRETAESPAFSGGVANFSVRTFLEQGRQTIVGIVIADNSKQVLIRAVGPGLASFSVPKVAGDPRVAIFRGAEMLASNDDWGKPAYPAPSEIAGLVRWQMAWLMTEQQLLFLFADCGAFSLQRASKDAALTISLPPGTYTAVVENAGDGGEVLVEVYQLSTPH